MTLKKLWPDSVHPAENLGRNNGTGNSGPFFISEGYVTAGEKAVPPGSPKGSQRVFFYERPFLEHSC